MELFTIVVGRNVVHPHWRPNAFVSLVDNEWGPSPTFQMVTVPFMFTTAREAQEVLDKHNLYGIEMRVATFVEKR